MIGRPCCTLRKPPRYTGATVHGCALMTSTNVAEAVGEVVALESLIREPRVQMHPPGACTMRTVTSPVEDPVAEILAGVLARQLACSRIEVHSGSLAGPSALRAGSRSLTLVASRRPRTICDTRDTLACRSA